MSRTAHRTVTKLPKPKARKLSPAGEAVFAAAVQHHQAGHLADAERLYRQVLAVNAGHADSLHLLGVVALQAGRPELAVDLIGQAIGIDATVALYHTNRGNALKALGRLDQAVACYRRAIVLRPRYPEAYSNLATALHALNQIDEALGWLRKAVAMKPDFPEAYNNLGNLLVDQGQLDEAAACYRRAIALRPGYADACNNLGTALKDAGSLEEAVVCYRTALAAQPDFAEASNNLGIALCRLGQLEEAAGCCHRAIALRPDLMEAHDALGAVLAKQGRLDEAAACCRQAVVLGPDAPRAHDNLGTVLKEQGLPEAALACFRTAIGLKLDFPNAHRNLAMALLAVGDMAEGWREHEWRWETADMAGARRAFVQPQWFGEAGGGRTLLIHAEQGLGDTLQFCRYAALAAAAGLRVVMEVQAPLVRLLGDLPAVDRIVARGEALPAFDLHCPMQSLPLALGTTLETIPAASLRADVGLAAAWGARLGAMGDRRPRVGVAWAGNPEMVRDRQRSLSPDRLAPLFGVDGLWFFSLQKDGTAAGVTDFMGEMGDFADTAGLVANLDLVISVDTAVAHLAAGLGKPVWLLDRFDPDW
ncbi:tetratricopeptide repeat protein, partial [Acidisphaera sp. S103]|uniref:tetratricopeptide repeat protein n=1 Tax=Acidisphaera sp. S103 TaxID=1747223 RepID=UPI00131E8B92